jgi:hypothetical protein
MKDMTRCERRRRNKVDGKRLGRLADLWGIDIETARKVRGMGNWPEDYQVDQIIPRKYRKSDLEALEFGVIAR